MQALKKAEQAKQKKNDLPIITEQIEPKVEMSLDEQHTHVNVEVEVKQEKKEPIIEQTNEQINEPINELIKDQLNAPSVASPSIFAELSLTPQHETVSLEKELLALNESKPNLVLQEQLQQVSAQEDVIPSAEKIEPITSPSASFVSEKPNEFSKPQDDDQIDAMKKNFSRPHIDVEKKQLSEQASENQLLEQKKAQAVFTSKVPQNKLRSRWISIVVIAMILSLIGVAYIYWQQSNNINGQFPVNAPLATQALPLEENATPAPEVSGAAASDGVSANTAKILGAENGDSVVKSDSNVSKGSKGSEANKAIENPLEKKTNATKINENIIADAKNSVDAPVNATRKPSSKNTNPANEIQISKGSSGAKINPSLYEAYQAYLAGDSQNATLKYQKVLQQEPNNRDALLGLAAIALNARQAEQAGAYYGQLLTLDPNDPEAIAGLTALQQGDPVQSESRLKSALNQTPNSGAILFALGNLYAQQSRWSDAQQTYFRAYTTTPNNADYAFNLAISLDRLNQRKLAIEYYQRAINLGKSGSVNFNLTKAQQRLTEIESLRDK